MNINQIEAAKCKQHFHLHSIQNPLRGVSCVRVNTQTIAFFCCSLHRNSTYGRLCARLKPNSILYLFPYDWYFNFIELNKISKSVAWNEVSSFREFGKFLLARIVCVLIETDLECMSEQWMRKVAWISHFSISKWIIENYQHPVGSKYSNLFRGNMLIVRAGNLRYVNDEGDEGEISRSKVNKWLKRVTMLHFVNASKKQNDILV